MWYKWCNRSCSAKLVSSLFTPFPSLPILWGIFLGCGLSLGLCSCRPTRTTPPRQLLPHARDYLSWKQITQRKITNSHKSTQNSHDTAEIYLNDQAHTISSGKENIGQGYPLGSTFVNIHYSEAGEKQPFAYVMRKMPDGYDPDNNNWRYTVVRLSDWTIEKDGRLVECIRCHQKQVARDYVPVMKKDFSTSGE